MSDENPNLQPWIDPELEARVAAWVLGESSDFEAAELERAIAENPELALFKRRIEAVHGLLRESAKLNLDPMRMAEPRRQELLSRLGGTPASKPQVTAMPASRKNRREFSTWEIGLAVAACFILLFALLPSVSPFTSIIQGMAGSGTASPEPVSVPIALPAKDVDHRMVAAVAPPPPSQPPRLAALDDLKAWEGKEAEDADQSNVADGRYKARFRLGTQTTNADIPVLSPEQPILGRAFRSEENFHPGKGFAFEGRQTDAFGNYTANKPDDSLGIAAGNNGPDHAAPRQAPLSADQIQALEKSDQKIAAMTGPAGSTMQAFQQPAAKNEASVELAGDAPKESNGVTSHVRFANRNGEGVFNFQTDVARNRSEAEQAAAPAMAGGNSYTGATTITSGQMQIAGRAAQPQMPQAAPAAAPAPPAMDLAAGETEGAAPAPANDGFMSVAPAASGAALAATASTTDQPAGPALPADTDATAAGTNIPSAMSGRGAGAGGDMDDAKQLISEAKKEEASGQYDKASRDYEKILSRYPDSISARRGEEEVNAERGQYAAQAYNQTRSELLWQVDKSWNMPVHKFGTKASREAEPGSIGDKLDKIVIPTVDFRDATLPEVANYLKKKSRELDPDGKGIDITIPDFGTEQSEAEAVAPASPAIPGLSNAQATAGAAATPQQARVTLSLKNVPLGDALKYVASLSNLQMKTGDTNVSLMPPSVGTEELITKEYKVPKDSVPNLTSGQNLLVQYGVQFPPGASAVYFPASSRLLVHNTASNIEAADRAVAEILAPDEISAADQPYSTFSLHVSDVSFKLAQQALAAGQLPDPDSVRPEEFYNAFDYGDPAAASGQKIACRIEQAAHPFLQDRNLVRIAMKVASSGRGAGQPLHLTVLLDTSGSMEREDRAASVQKAMEVLSTLLGPDDRVTLIGFAREPRLLADNIPGDQAAKLAEIAKHTPPQGGTNMEEALKAAFEKAMNSFQAGAQNRVVMLTDGAANLGDADPGKLSQMVADFRQKGLSFDACGVGAGGLNDDMLEALTRKGGGRYYLINSPADADAGFAQQLAGAFRPAAENVKMQVRFNPSRVGKYRLVGFEKHRLNQEDFRNDKVTAAQLAAEEAAVAVYQVQVLPQGEGQIGEVFVRFHDPVENRMVEQSWTIPSDAAAPALDKAAPSMQLAAASMMVAEKLRGGLAAAQIDLNALAPVIAQVRGHYAAQQPVQQFVTMFEQARRMTEQH